MRTDPRGNPLAPRLYWKHGRYWYVYRNRWEPLSTHYAEAMARYGRLVTPGNGMDALVDKVLLLLDKRKPPLAKSTIEQYRYAGRLIKNAFSEFTPAEVTQATVAQFHDTLAVDHVNMANRCLTVLRIVFGYACRWQLTTHNPAIGLRTAPERKRDRYLTDGEYAALRAVASPWCALLMDILYLTGQRVGDVLALRRLDVTVEGVEFRQQKTGKRIRVTMTDDLRLVLAEALALHGNVLSPFVFHPRGKGDAYGYRAAQAAYSRARRKAGIRDTTLHDIRAKSLTDADQEGKDATALAGHTSAAMTSRYLRLRRMQTVLGPAALRGKS